MIPGGSTRGNGNCLAAKRWDICGGNGLQLKDRPKRFVQGLCRGENWHSDRKCDRKNLLLPEINSSPFGPEQHSGV